MENHNNSINSQFKYCPVIWIFRNRHLNNKINRLHERFYDLSVMINNLGVKNYWVKKVLSRYITGIYKCFQLRCIK